MQTQSFGRIWAIASNGFREVIRDRVLYIVGFFALLLIISLRLLPEVAAATENKIFIDLGLAAISILSVLVAVFVGTGLINKEIDRRTVLLLIPKPLSRAEFIIGKYFGLLGVLGVLIIALTVIYLILLSFSKIEYPLGSILVSTIFLFLELCLITGVALMFGVFTSSILATLLTFSVYLMGHMSRDLLALGKLSKNSSVEVLTQGIYLLLPDLSRLNLKNEAVYGLLPDPQILLGHTVYALVYTILLLAIAILIFSRREF